MTTVAPEIQNRCSITPPILWKLKGSALPICRWVDNSTAAGMDRASNIQWRCTRYSVKLLNEGHYLPLCCTLLVPLVIMTFFSWSGSCHDEMWIRWCHHIWLRKLWWPLLKMGINHDIIMTDPVMTGGSLHIILSHIETNLQLLPDWYHPTKSLIIIVFLRDYNDAFYL